MSSDSLVRVHPTLPVRRHSRAPFALPVIRSSKILGWTQDSCTFVLWNLSWAAFSVFIWILNCQVLIRL